jgi:hypothetical protein
MDHPVDARETGRPTTVRRGTDWGSSSILWAVVGLIVIAVIAWIAFGALDSDPTLPTDSSLQEPAGAPTEATEAPEGTVADPMTEPGDTAGTAAGSDAVAPTGDLSDDTDPGVVADPLDGGTTGGATDGDVDAGEGQTTGEDGTPAGE